MTPLRLTFPIPPFLQVTWLAKWKDSINGEDKCVWLAANSSWKGKSDLAKYEKARKLKDHIGKVREDYMAGMRSKKEAQQQKAVAVRIGTRLGPRQRGERARRLIAHHALPSPTTGVPHRQAGAPRRQREEHRRGGRHRRLLLAPRRARQARRRREPAPPQLPRQGESRRYTHRPPPTEAHPSPNAHRSPPAQDSIVYDNTTPVIPEAFTLIQKFLANKKGSDQVFDHVQPEVRTGTRLGRGAAPHTRAQPRAAHPAPPSAL